MRHFRPFPQALALVWDWRRRYPGHTPRYGAWIIGKLSYGWRYVRKTYTKRIDASLDCRWRTVRAAVLPCRPDPPKGGAFGGGTCESTAPSPRSTVIFARQHGHSRSNVTLLRFAMAPFYAEFLLTEVPPPPQLPVKLRHSRISGLETDCAAGRVCASPSCRAARACTGRCCRAPALS